MKPAPPPPGPRDRDAYLISRPTPMYRPWWRGGGKMTMLEAERFHLKRAADLALSAPGDEAMADVVYRSHLLEAAANRAWRLWNAKMMPTPIRW